MTARRVTVGLALAMIVVGSGVCLAQQRPKPPRATVTPPSPTDSSERTPLSYNRQSRRDPFEPVKLPEVPVVREVKLVVATARLKGIIRGGSTRALLETADGIGYIMKPGDTLAEGRLIEIGTDRVVFRVALRPGLTSDRVVLRLPAE